MLISPIHGMWVVASSVIAITSQKNQVTVSLAGIPPIVISDPSLDSKKYAELLAQAINQSMMPNPKAKR